MSDSLAHLQTGGFSSGPRSFPVERMIAIFNNIVDEEIAQVANMNIYTQVHGHVHTYMCMLII